MSDDVLHRHVIIKLGGRICHPLIGNNQRGKKDGQDARPDWQTQTVGNSAEQKTRNEQAAPRPWKNVPRIQVS